MLTEPVHLYIKTHIATGVKYFGRTVSDPYNYSGSGTQWKKLLKDHGFGHTTEIYGTYSDIEELEMAARQFSKDFSIVASEKWANLKIENGLHPDKTGAIFIDDSKSRIKNRDLSPGLRSKLHLGFFTAMSDEEREGTLLGLNPIIDLNLINAPRQLASVFKIATTPGKLEPGAELSFAYELVDRYGIRFTGEMFDRLLAFFPPKDIYDLILTDKIAKQRVLAERMAIEEARIGRKIIIR